MARPFRRLDGRLTVHGPSDHRDESETTSRPLPTAHAHGPSEPETSRPILRIIRDNETPNRRPIIPTSYAVGDPLGQLAATLEEQPSIMLRCSDSEARRSSIDGEQRPRVVRVVTFARTCGGHSVFKPHVRFGRIFSLFGMRCLNETLRQASEELIAKLQEMPRHIRAKLL